MKDLDLEKLNHMSAPELKDYIGDLYSEQRENIVFGYCRVSTRGQAVDGNSLASQEMAVRQSGATCIYKDAYTGTATARPEFTKLLHELRSGDTLIVTKLDRIARSAAQGSSLIQGLLDKGITVNVLNMGVIDDSPTGRLMMNILLSFAEFERDMILERTREGKRIAREKPDYREGRPLKFTRQQISHAMDLLESHSYNQVVRMTGISKSTLMRAKRTSRNEVTKYGI